MKNTQTAKKYRNQTQKSIYRLPSSGVFVLRVLMNSFLYRERTVYFFSFFNLFMVFLTWKKTESFTHFYHSQCAMTLKLTASNSTDTHVSFERAITTVSQQLGYSILFELTEILL